MYDLVQFMYVLHSSRTKPPLQCLWRKKRFQFALANLGQSRSIAAIQGSTTLSSNCHGSYTATSGLLLFSKAFPVGLNCLQWASIYHCYVYVTVQQILLLRSSINMLSMHVTVIFEKRCYSWRYAVVYSYLLWWYIATQIWSNLVLCFHIKSTGS